jgi:hypothetical protein
MRTSFLSLALLAAVSARAVAQPAPPCEVVIARAPDAARAEIERWLAVEPHCARGLEVRIVETTDGLYLFARDDRGFTRERMVPDAATAAALVMSWAADDSVDGVWQQPAPEPVTPAPALAPLPPPPAVVDRGAHLRTIGLVLAGAGVAVIAGGVVEGFRAKSISDSIAAQPPGSPWSPDILDREREGEHAERLEQLLLVGGGSLLVSGVATYLVGRSRRAEMITITPAPAGASVGVSGRF